MRPSSDAGHYPYSPASSIGTRHIFDARRSRPAIEGFSDARTTLKPSAGNAEKQTTRTLREGFGVVASEEITMVGREGFEPTKAMPADLQSAPFGHLGTDPTIEL